MCAKLSFKFSVAYTYTTRIIGVNNRGNRSTPRREDIMSDNFFTLTDNFFTPTEEEWKEGEEEGVRFFEDMRRSFPDMFNDPIEF